MTNADKPAVLKPWSAERYALQGLARESERLVFSCFYKLEEKSFVLEVFNVLQNLLISDNALT
jgi:hypothetical protein